MGVGPTNVSREVLLPSLLMSFSVSTAVSSMVLSLKGLSEVSLYSK